MSGLLFLHNLFVDEHRKGVMYDINYINNYNYGFDYKDYANYKHDKETKTN